MPTEQAARPELVERKPVPGMDESQTVPDESYKTPFPIDRGATANRYAKSPGSVHGEVGTRRAEQSRAERSDSGSEAWTGPRRSRRWHPRTELGPLDLAAQARRESPESRLTSEHIGMPRPSRRWGTASREGGAYAPIRTAATASPPQVPIRT